MKPLTSLKVNRKTILSKYAIYMVLFVMVVVLSIGTRSFRTTRNFLNVLRQISMNAIVAFGMTYVIISDGIDLSVAPPSHWPVYWRPILPIRASTH